jgi:antitoxin MazE
MKVQVKKWGNSLALRIPKSFANQTKISKGSLVDLSIKNDNLIIAPVLEEEEYSLKSFLSKIDESNIHSEVDFGLSVGKELL